MCGHSLHWGHFQRPSFEKKLSNAIYSFIFLVSLLSFDSLPCTTTLSPLTLFRGVKHVEGKLITRGIVTP